MQEGTVDQFVAGLVALLVLSEIIASRATTDTVATSASSTRCCCPSTNGRASSGCSA
jgi:hypothetical protein